MFYGRILKSVPCVVSVHKAADLMTFFSSFRVRNRDEVLATGKKSADYFVGVVSKPVVR
jgi:hypothetical protein